MRLFLLSSPFYADRFERIQISNTLPKGNWRQVDKEISLTTRRDTRWEKVV